jgi:hypothetical protein
MGVGVRQVSKTEIQAQAGTVGYLKARQQNFFSWYRVFSRLIVCHEFNTLPAFPEIALIPK